MSAADLFIGGPQHRPRAAAGARSSRSARIASIDAAIPLSCRRFLDHADGPSRSRIGMRSTCLSATPYRSAREAESAVAEWHSRRHRVPLRAHMIARCRLPEVRDICANFDQSSRKPGAASIDGILVIARRFKTHKDFERVAQPAELRRAELEQVDVMTAHRFQSICAFGTFLWLNKEMMGRTFSRPSLGRCARNIRDCGSAKPRPFPAPGPAPSRPPTQSPQPPTASVPCTGNRVSRR